MIIVLQGAGRKPRQTPLVGTDLRRFRPRLALGYQQRLGSLVERLSEVDPARWETLLEEAVNEADNHEAVLLACGIERADLVPTMRYSTTLRLLRDLLGQGWTLSSDDEGVILNPPGSASPQERDTEQKKEALRRSFSFARDAQLAQTATSRFVSSMERRGIDILFAAVPRTSSICCGSSYT